MNKVWIFDIDGTLANVHHRWHHINGGGKKNWDAFFADQIKDEPYQPVMDILHALVSHYVDGRNKVIFVTARDERFREVSLQWLNRHIEYKVSNEDLYMRPGGNREDDDLIKVRIIKNWLQRHPAYEVGAIFEDRHRIIDAFRAEGWYTFECNQQRLEF